MHLIIIGGMPGAGKTSIANRLAGDLNLPLLCKDAFKEILFDTVGFGSRDEKNALGVAATEAMYYSAKSILSHGGSVVIENNFDNNARPGLMRLIEETGARPLTVIVDCEYFVLYRRVIERDQSPARHRGHVVNTAYPEPDGPKPAYAGPAFDATERGMEARGFRAFDVGGERIVADTTDFDAFDYESLLEKMRRSLKL